MARLGEISRIFSRLGFTSFGGPTAHLGYFHTEFVDRRSWMKPQAFSEIVALSQFLPGPGSSQVGMALGYHRGSWPGALLAFLLFTAPSAVLMAIFGLIIVDVDTTGGWMAGLLAVAVAVVFHAVSGMASSMANTPWTATVAIAAGIAILAGASPLLVIVIAAFIGLAVAKADTSNTSDQDFRPVSLTAAVTSLVAFVVLLVGLRIGTFFSDNPIFSRGSAYAETGAAVFGGGHVVLPLLQERTQEWIEPDTFLAGYSAAQAVPGPMFTFATYLGAVDGGIAGAIYATIMIFLPPMLLMIAGLHFWSRWRSRAWMQKALTGINAAVVGVLLAALVNPVIMHGVRDLPSLAIAAVAWLALAQWKLPSWAIALGGAAAGALLL